MPNQARSKLVGLAVNIAWLGAAIFGYTQSGWLGALTGLLGGLLAYISAGGALQARGIHRRPMAIGFSIGFVAVLTGLGIGGWDWGWAGAIAGALLGVVIARVLVRIAAARRAPEIEELLAQMQEDSPGPPR